MCFVYPESCYTLGITNCLASKLSTAFICLDRFCCRWAPVINNYKYLTALHCLDPLWLNRQECKMERQLNIWLWMTKASVCTVVWQKKGNAQTILLLWGCIQTLCTTPMESYNMRAGPHSPGPLFSTRWTCTLYNLFYKPHWTQR